LSHEHAITVVSRIKTIALITIALVASGQNRSEAALFHAIIPNLANGPKASAQLDLSMDAAAGEGAPIDVTVFHNDGTRQDFQILTNERGFASTTQVQDLLAGAAGQTVLVQAATPTGIGTATAVLREKFQGQKIILGVPPATTEENTPLTSGTRHTVAIGDVVPGTSLLIGNVTDGQPADVRVFVGSDVFAPRFVNPELGVRKVWEVELTAAEAQSNVIVVSDVPVIVQLVVEDGKKIDEAMVVAN
jgi:hypothetical protein